MESTKICRRCKQTLSRENFSRSPKQKACDACLERKSIKQERKKSLRMEDGRTYKSRDYLLKTCLQIESETPYKAYIKSALWRDIKHRVLALYGDRCWVCGDGYYVLHHFRYALEDLDGTNLTNIYPLCDSCHEKVHRVQSGNGEGRIANFDKARLQFLDMLPFEQARKVSENDSVYLKNDLLNTRVANFTRAYRQTHIKQKKVKPKKVRNYTLQQLSCALPLMSNEVLDQSISVCMNQGKELLKQLALTKKKVELLRGEKELRKHNVLCSSPDKSSLVHGNSDKVESDCQFDNQIGFR